MVMKAATTVEGKWCSKLDKKNDKAFTTDVEM